MEPTGVALVLLVVGLLLCLSGAATARALMAVGAAAAGFWLGASIAAGVTGQPLLTDFLGWMAAILGALLAAALVYAVYALAIIACTGSLGYALGVSGAGAAGVTHERTVLIVGVATAAVAVVLAVALNLPRLLLIALTVLAGSGAAVTGAMLLTGQLSAVPVDQAAVGRTLAAHPWWGAAYLALCLLGAAVQLRRRQSAPAPLLGRRRPARV